MSTGHVTVPPLLNNQDEMSASFTPKSLLGVSRTFGEDPDLYVRRTEFTGPNRRDRYPEISLLPCVSPT